MSDIDIRDEGLKNLPGSISAKLRKVLQANQPGIVSLIRTKYLTEKLKVRTGRLRASAKAAPISTTTDAVQGGVIFGTVYGRVHIGPRGQETTIRPVRRKFLTIPLDAAKTRAGVARGSAPEGPWGDTFITKTEDGKLIIFGRKRVMRGQKAGSLRGGIIPLFLLVKQVKIKARIHPEDILDDMEPILVQAIKAEGLGGK